MKAPLKGNECCRNHQFLNFINYGLAQAWGYILKLKSYTTRKINVMNSIGTFAFITLHFTRQTWSQWFDAEWFWCLIDRMEKFVIPLRFEFECISFGSLGQNSLVVPLPNVIQTTLHCIYIYLPTSQCQSKYIDTTYLHFHWLIFIINVKPHGLLFSSMSRNWKVEVSLAFLSFSNSLWTFLFRKLSISKFKLQVSFSLGSFVSGKIVWNALSPSFTYLGASWSIENNRF